MERLTLADTDLPAEVYASGFEFTCELPDTPEVAAVLPLVRKGDRACVTNRGETWNGLVSFVLNLGGQREVVVNAEPPNWW